MADYPFSPKRIITAFGQLMLIAIFGFLTREAWKGYRQERLTLLFAKEARQVPVVVDDISNERKIWKDYIGNSKYIHFFYHNKAYTLRYVQDSGWVGPGTHLVLLYHSERDEFRRQAGVYHPDRLYKTSKLVDWTLLKLFSVKNLWLFAFILLGLILFVFVVGMIANLTASDSLYWVNDTVVGIALIVAVLFFTVDAWKYYTLARKIRSGSAPVNLTLLDKEETVMDRPRASGEIPFFYSYTARVHFNNEDRIAPISKKEYNDTKKGDQLNMLYDQQLDELISAGFSPSWFYGSFVIMIWGLMLFYLYQKFSRRRKPKDVVKKG